MLPNYFYPNVSTAQLAIIKTDIKDKISKLYIDRRISEYKKQLYLGFWQRRKLKRKLTNLQFIIYNLDLYGENNWEISKSIIDSLWNKIVESIVSIGIYEDKAKEILIPMEKYMNFEISIRSGQLPTDISIEEFYEYKICDVQLQRNIILLISQKEIDHILQEAWKYFDKISEIADDLDDLSEDFDDYNCNRILIAANNYDTPTTITEYVKYINQLKYGFSELISPSNKSDIKSKLAKISIWFEDKSNYCLNAFKEFENIRSTYKLLDKFKQNRKL